jgi:hypothetical protein
MVSQAQVTPRTAHVPWESIDPEDAVCVASVAEVGAGFYLDPPEGEWEIESPATVAGSADADEVVAVQLQVELGETDEEEPVDPLPERGGWAITLLCIGLGLIMACVIIPESDANQRMAYQRETLRLDLAQIQHQVEINKQFLAKIESDPQLTLRLIQREMHAVPRGEKVLDVGSTSGEDAHGSSQSEQAERVSPFFIVNIPPAPRLPPYQLSGGLLANLCRGAQSRLYLMGGALLLVAIGLVGGEPARPSVDTTMLKADDEDDEADAKGSALGDVVE